MESFADNSPPGVEISIDYELPEGTEINIKNQVAQVWQAIKYESGEGRIAVYDCDLKCWPGSDESIYNNSNNIARANSRYDDALFWPIKSLYTKNVLIISDDFKTQYRVFVDKTEVFSLFGK